MKNTLKFYSKIYDPLFDKAYTKTANRGEPALRKFQELINKNNLEIKNVIDVGCAWGRTLRYWKKMGVKATGVDVSKKVVLKNKRKGYECHLASATDLSIFKDKKFDLYMATDVYEHLRTEDLSCAIEEAKRITKKYFLIRPHPTLDKRGRRNIREALHLTVWSIEKWQDFFEDHDLEITKIGEDGEITYKNVFLLKITGE